MSNICANSGSSDLSHPRWEAMWSEGINPGDRFDASGISPLLKTYLEEGKIPFGRALVPGCGRGYDVTALSHEKRYVLGLDISTTAIAAARSRLESLSSSECANKDNAKFSTESFFNLDTAHEENKFDFIYDYTFLCALDPSIRKDWANKMAALVRPGSGELLTMIYPIMELEGGPPFKVSMQLFKSCYCRGISSAWSCECYHQSYVILGEMEQILRDWPSLQWVDGGRKPATEVQLLSW